MTKKPRRWWLVVCDEGEMPCPGVAYEQRSEARLWAKHAVGIDHRHRVARVVEESKARRVRR